jgi:hypothetical protein
MLASTSSSFDRHVYAVQHYVMLTAPRYAVLFRPGLFVHPICCFGDPAEARIVTVEGNPSDSEFVSARNWPDSQMDHAALAARYRNYFTEPHKWFAPWTEGLDYLKAGYSDGSAVHVDLSPRATRLGSDFKKAWEQELFLEMGSAICGRSSGHWSYARTRTLSSWQELSRVSITSTSLSSGLLGRILTLFLR